MTQSGGKLKSIAMRWPSPNIYTWDVADVIYKFNWDAIAPELEKEREMLSNNSDETLLDSILDLVDNHGELDPGYRVEGLRLIAGYRYRLEAELGLAIARAVQLEANSWNRESKTYEWRRDRLQANRARVEALKGKIPT